MGEIAEGEQGVATYTSTTGDTSSVSPIHALVPDVLVVNVSAVCHQWSFLLHPSYDRQSKALKGLVNYRALFVGAFRFFLRRSGQAPLDLSINLRDGFRNPGLLASVLNVNQTRLRNIEISNIYPDQDLQTYWTLTNLSIIEDFRLYWHCEIPIHLELKYAPVLWSLWLERVSPWASTRI